MVTDEQKAAIGIGAIIAGLLAALGLSKANGDGDGNGTPGRGQWSDEFRCAGTTQERLWIRSDGSTVWRTWKEESIPCGFVPPTTPGTIEFTIQGSSGPRIWRAVIEILEFPFEKVIATGKTNTSGKATLRNLPSEEQLTVRVSASGYLPSSMFITIPSGFTIRETIILQKVDPSINQNLMEVVKVGETRVDATYFDHKKGEIVTNNFSPSPLSGFSQFLDGWVRDGIINSTQRTSFISQLIALGF